jgi:hypothetical protein
MLTAGAPVVQLQLVSAGPCSDQTTRVCRLHNVPFDTRKTIKMGLA